MKSWPKMQFCEVARVVTGNTPPRAESENYGGTIPWVKPPDLDTPEPITQTSEFLTEQGAKKARLLPKGSVMVGCIGRVGIVGIAGTECATNQQINSLVFGPKVLPKFGYYACVYLAPVIKARAGQAVLPLLNKGDFEQLEMPVPDLREQTRIVELLDQADALRRQRAEADAKLAHLLPALFRHHFGDPDTNPHKWPVSTIGDALLDSSYGLSLSASSEPRGTPFLRMNNIRFDGTLDLESLKYVELDTEELAKNRLRNGDLLFNRTNSADLVGKTGLWRDAFPAVAASYLIILRVDRAQVEPDFVWAWMNTPSFKSILLNRGRRAIGMANINSTELKSFPLFIPPLDKQRRFLAALELITETKTHAVASAAKLETLFQTLLHRAFTGELTARWREAHLREGVQELSRLSRA